MREILWAAATALALWAGWLDWKTRKIPNWLTVPGLVVGVLASSVIFGWSGAKTALSGAGLALGLLLPFVLFRGLGAGDWKLMGALGAFLGPKQILLVLLISFLLAGILAILQTTWHRRWKVTTRNLGELLRISFVFGLRPHPVVNLGNPRLPSLPFGSTAAVATLFCYWAAGV